MSAHFGPYPLFIERASGCRMHDADGHEIIDFMNNFTSLMLGHANPAVVRAVSEQMQRGSAYAAPTRSQVALAEIIRSRVPSIEQLRFTSSGSEATLMTLRCARAFTRRQKIMKMEAPITAATNCRGRPGAAAGPVRTARCTGVRAGGCRHSGQRARRAVSVQRARMARTLIRKRGRTRRGDRRAGARQHGMIPATTKCARCAKRKQKTTPADTDEVITLRLPTAVSGVYGVTRLTKMGKIIGVCRSGAPGRTDLMRMFHPDQSNRDAREHVQRQSDFDGRRRA
jgi:glutamate-1-semialdehyde 2,1-aminomutase